MTDSENTGANNDERDDKVADPQTDPVAEGGLVNDGPPDAADSDSDGGPGAEVGMSDEPNTFEPEEDPDAAK